MPPPDHDALGIIWYWLAAGMPLPYERTWAERAEIAAARRKLTFNEGPPGPAAEW